MSNMPSSLKKIKRKKLEKKEKRVLFSSKNMIGLFIILMMVLSGAAYYWQKDIGKETTKGFQLVSKADGWHLIKDGMDFRLDSHPSSVAGINASNATIGLIKNSKFIYLSFSPDDRLIKAIESARLDFEESLGKLGTYVITGVEKNTSAYAGFPIISCMNATSFVPVIILQYSANASITTKNNCIIISAETSSGLLEEKDRIIYGVLGII